jgi:hypothetical protein
VAGVLTIGSDDRVISKERTGFRIGVGRGLDMNAIGAGPAHAMGVALKKKGGIMGVAQGFQKFCRFQLFRTRRHQDRRNITGRQGLFDHLARRFRSYPRRND